MQRSPLNWGLSLLCVFSFVVKPSFAEQQNCKHDTTTFRCVKYLKNYDGDTITFNIPDVHPLIGNQVSVRVAHLDTPEIKSSNSCEKVAARNAKNLIENLLKNSKRIDLTEINRDKYFRILANVIADGKSIKEILLKNKLAYPYEGGTKQTRNWCQATQKSGNSTIPLSPKKGL